MTGALTTCFNLHGVELTVEAESPALLEALGSLAAPYAQAGGDGGNGFLLRLRYGPASRNPGSELQEFWSGTLPDNTPLVCRRAPGRRQFDVPQGICSDLDLPRRQATVVVRPGAERALLEACFIPLLCECLAEGGHYVIHAASLFVQAGAQRGALVVSGVSGAGKTTLALALAGAGLGLLTDDMTFYQPSAPGRAGHIWGIRTGCKILPGTIELLSRMARTGAGSPGDDAVDTARLLGPPTTGLSAAPGLLLFLNPRDPTAHRLEPLDKFTALARLTRENIRVFESRREAGAGRAFEALAQLVRSSHTFQASLCPRLEELPELIASLWRKCC